MASSGQEADAPELTNDMFLEYLLNYTGNGEKSLNPEVSEFIHKEGVECAIEDKG